MLTGNIYTEARYTVIYEEYIMLLIIEMQIHSFVNFGKLFAIQRADKKKEETGIF